MDGGEKDRDQKKKTEKCGGNDRRRQNRKGRTEKLLNRESKNYFMSCYSIVYEVFFLEFLKKYLLNRVVESGLEFNLKGPVFINNNRPAQRFDQGFQIHFLWD